MSKFKIGDKVIVNGETNMLHFENDYAVVKDILANDFVAVQFKHKYDNLHSCAGKCARNRGYWVSEDMLTKLEPIVIYRDGNKTVAFDKSNGKKAIARCHPDDKYDMYEGARIALDRLSGREPFEPVQGLYNGKVVFTQPADGFTKGRIYEIVDGKIVNDMNNMYPVIAHFEKFEDVEYYFLGGVIEIEE